MAKVMIVTGGSRGIGAATCRLGAERGYAVVVNYVRDADAANAVVSDIEARGGQAAAVKGDVAEEAGVAAIFGAADRLGTLAVLVNNAGIVEEPTRVADYTRDSFAKVFAANVTGSFFCAQEAVRRMSTAKGGAGGTIVNVSSAAAKLGAGGERVAYAASKGAIDTFTVGLAKEVVGEGIRVSAVRPGIIDTDIHASGGQPGRVEAVASGLPTGRAGTAEEIAQAILWLASDEASYSQGAILDASGARSILP